MPFLPLTVHDRVSGALLGPLNRADDRALTSALRAPHAFSFTADMREPASDYLLTGQALVRLRERDQRFVAPFGVNTIDRFIGPVQRATEQGAAGKITVSCTSPLGDNDGRRPFGRSRVGLTFAVGTTRIGMAAFALGVVNAQYPTLVDWGTPTTILTTGPGGGPYTFKPLLEFLQEIANVQGGFDWIERPIGFDSSGGSLKVVELDTWDARGGPKPAAKWEMGVGRYTMTDYQRDLDFAGRANLVDVLPPGWPDSASDIDLRLATDLGSIGDAGMFEAVEASEVFDPDFRQSLANLHLAIRKSGKQAITFTSVADGYMRDGKRVQVPKWGVDYNLGDVVGGRAVKFGRERFNGDFRVYGVTQTANRQGQITELPTVVPEET